MAEVASWALQRGVYQALAGSVDLTTLLGGVCVYDNAPRAAPYPFITLAEAAAGCDPQRHEDRRFSVSRASAWRSRVT